MGIGQKYILPLSLGFVGMFVCHVFILIAFGSGTRFPIYIFAYPVVYPLIAAILTFINSKLWLSNAMLVNSLPFVYWYLLLWSDGKMNMPAALNLQESSGMLLIMPFTIALACVVTYIVSRIKKSTQPADIRGS